MLLVSAVLGFWWGFLVATIGTAIGMLLAFLVGKQIFRDRLHRYVLCHCKLHLSNVVQYWYVLELTAKVCQADTVILLFVVDGSKATIRLKLCCWLSLKQGLSRYHNSTRNSLIVEASVGIRIQAQVLLSMRKSAQHVR